MKKVTFREHPNRSIDITWAMRGTAGRTGFYDCPRWPGQTNLYLLQSVAGIEHVHIYDKNMTKADYIELLQEVGPKMRAAGIDGRFSIYLHDNLLRNGEPIEELNIYIGRGRYTRYMGAPCTRPHDWKKHRSEKYQHGWQKKDVIVNSHWARSTQVSTQS